MQYEFHDQHGLFASADLDSDDAAINEADLELMAKGRSFVKVYEGNPSLSREEALVAFAQSLGPGHVMTQRRPFSEGAARAIHLAGQPVE